MGDDRGKSWVTAAAHAILRLERAATRCRIALESVIYLVRRNAPGVRVIAGFDGLGLRGTTRRRSRSRAGTRRG